MADVSIITRLLNGVHRNVDISQNTLVVGSLKVGTSSPTELTKAILDRLVTLQNGSDVDATHHTHDGRYYTETELGSISGTMGAQLIGIGTTPTNYTPAQNHVRAHLEAIDTALATAGGSDFSDAVFRISDDVTPSKKIAFQASGISASNVRTITMPDADVNLGLVATAIQRDGSVAFTANQSFGSFKATNLADPTSAQDAATKAYVDSLLDGRSWKQPVRVASTANIDLSVAADPSPVDGVTLANNDRVLLKDQTAPEENGIYVAVNAQDPTTWVRASDSNTATELVGAAVFVSEGTASGDKQFAQTSHNITLETTPLVWVVTSANSFSGHDMIALSGGQISVDLAAVSGLESSNPGNAAGQLRVKLEASNPTLLITGSNELAAKLDAAGAIITGASGLAVAVDDSTIERNSNAIRVKDLGITSAKLATDSVITVKVQDAAITSAKLNSDVADQSTITGGAGTALAVQKAPALRKTMVAGESMAANTSFLVRMARDGETAGRVYKADRDATSADNFYVIGVVMSTVAVSAGDSVVVTLMGSHDLGSSDTPFASADVGKPVFLTANGAFSITAPNAANHAVTRLGIIETTTRILVQPAVVGVN